MKRIMLDVTKETLERAPSFARDRWPDTRDQQWSRDTQKYWSDTTITTAVKSRLAKEKAATLTKVDVDTRQGVVELNGSVDSSATKQRAGDLAQQVDGGAPCCEQPEGPGQLTVGRSHRSWEAQGIP